MSEASALAFLQGQLLPIYRPVAGASVTPDAQYTKDDVILQGAFTPPTGATSTTNRMQVTAPATVSLLGPAAASPYAGVITGTVSGCTYGGSAGTPIDSVVDDLVTSPGNGIWSGHASGVSAAGTHHVFMYILTGIYVIDPANPTGAAVDAAGNWTMAATPADGFERTFRLIRNSDGAQIGAEWRNATKTWHSSGVRILSFLYSDVYYSMDGPAISAFPQFVDVLIDPGGSHTDGQFAITAVGFGKEWRLRLVDEATMLTQIGAEWQGVNGNSATYDGLEIRLCVVTDRDYVINRHNASVSNRWYWNHPIARKSIRLHLITDADGPMPAPQAEWTMTTGLQRSTNYLVTDTGYGTSSEDVAFVYDASVMIRALIGKGDLANAKAMGLGLIALQFPDGSFPFSGRQRAEFVQPAYLRTGNIAWVVASLMALKQALPLAMQDLRIDTAARAGLGWLLTMQDSTGLVLGGHGNYWPQWLASTAYTAGNDTRVFNGGNTYKCVVSGTSASSGGPTGTGTGIVDGTVHWDFVIASDLDTTYAIPWYSTEHNLDTWVALNLGFELFGTPAYQVAADRLRTAILSFLWNAAGGYFYQGYLDSTSALDVNTWGAAILNRWGEDAKARQAIAHIDAHYQVTFSGVVGYRPYSDFDGVVRPDSVPYSCLWNEGSWGAMFAKQRLADPTTSTLAAGLATLQETDGGFRYAMTADPPDFHTKETVIGGAWYLLYLHPTALWTETPAAEPPRRFLHVEVWDNLECDGGAILVIVPGSDALSVACNRSVDQEQTCTLTLPKLSTARESIVEGRVITLRYEDGTAEEWRVLKITDALTADGKVLTTAQAVHPVMDLAEMPLLRVVGSGGLPSYQFGSVGLSPEEHITAEILPNCPSWIVLGRIDPTVLLTIDYDKATPYAAIQQIISGVLAVRVPCELRFRRIGGVAYAIDLVSEVGEEADEITLWSGVHVTDIQLATDATDQTTKVQPFGTSDATMARAAWAVTVISGTVLELSDPDGFANPILFDDQLTAARELPNPPHGLYIVGPATGTLFEITACTADPPRVTISDTSEFTDGDEVEFRETLTGTLLDYLTAPGRRVKFGSITDNTLGGDYNLIPNPYQNAWTNPTIPADGWAATAFGGSPDSSQRASTDVASFGLFSLRLLNSYVVTPETPWIAVTPDALTVSCKARVKVNGLPLFVDGSGLRGQVEVMLVHASDTAGSAPIARVKTAGEILPTTGDPQFANGFFDLVMAGVQLPSSGRYRLRVSLNTEDHPPGTVGGPFDVEVKAAQITQTPVDAPWMIGSSARRLWHLANYQLNRGQDVATQYTGNVLDRARQDPERWAHVNLTLGGRVCVIAEPLGLETHVRLLAFSHDLVKGVVTSVTFGAQSFGPQRQTFTRLLAASIVGP